MMNKNFFRMGLIVALSLIQVQCTKIEREDPVIAEEELRNKLTLSQYYNAMYLGSDFARFPLMWMQQLSGVRGSHLQVENYNPVMAHFDDTWQLFYFNLVREMSLLEYYAVELNAPRFSGMGLAMQAWMFGLVTDAWGDVPFSEAYKYHGMGSNPVYDGQEAVYNAIFKTLDDSMEMLETPVEGTLVPRPSDDFYYEGDVEKWKKFVRFLRLRHTLRLNHLSGDYSGALALVQAGGMFESVADDLVFPFANMAELENPWYLFDYAIGNTRVGAFLVDRLQATDDPRLGKYVRLTTQNERIGAAPGSENLNASRIANSGGTIGSQNAGLTMAGYSEQKFIEAEVYHRMGMPAQADAAYAAAVIASLEMHQARNAQWEEEHALREQVSLEDIMTAKYVALFLNPEVWTDWRRTGYPVFETVPPANQNGDLVPRRLLYPAFEEQNNPVNFPLNVDINTRVWWDRVE
jgi:hypothetical protein